MLNLFNVALYILIPSVHKSIQISLIIAESHKWSKSLTREPPKQWLCETAPGHAGMHFSFAVFTMVWESLYVANTSPLEYQKSLQCWKTKTILPNAIYPPNIENIEFLIKVSDVKKPLYCVNGLFVIIYDSHIVKWPPYCKHPNILIFYEAKFAFLKLSAYHSFPKSFLTVCCYFEAKNSS